MRHCELIIYYTHRVARADIVRRIKMRTDNVTLNLGGNDDKCNVFYYYE